MSRHEGDCVCAEKTVLSVSQCLSWSFFGPVLRAGVSCDVCGKSNFRGKRFKCLICYDYDLCSSCYDNNSASGSSGSHSIDHPVQCILTRADHGRWLSCSTPLWASINFYQEAEKPLVRKIESGVENYTLIFCNEISNSASTIKSFYYNL